MSDRKKALKSFTYGLVAGAACLPAWRYYRKWRVPSPKKIQSIVLPMLRANSDVRSLVGTYLQKGQLSAHSYSGGLHWKLPQFSSWTSLLPVGYKPLSVKLLFQVIGDKNTGLVSLEMDRQDFKYLLIDFSDGQRLILKGKDNSSKGTSLEYRQL